MTISRIQYWVKSMM